MGAVEITTVDAADGVQVRLEEGARVFADRLEGDGVNRTLQLAGDDVMVLRAQRGRGQLRDVQIRRCVANRSRDGARSIPVLRRRAWCRTPRVGSNVRPRRPRTSLAATWSQAMLYNEAANERWRAA